VKIAGKGFVVGSTTVKFGSTAATTVICSSATLCTATSPSGTAGTVNVKVTTRHGTSATSAADKFSYDQVPIVTGLTPSTGPLAGGTVVTITGAGFVVGSTKVKFGAKAGTSVTCKSTTSCKVTAPVGTAGAADVTVSTPGGKSATSAAHSFSYKAAAK